MTGTNSAPARIWAAPPYDDPEWKSGAGEWDVSEDWAASEVTQYVRADLVVDQVIAFLNSQHILYTAGIGRDPEQYSSRFSVAANTLETAARRDKSSVDSNRWEAK